MTTTDARVLTGTVTEVRPDGSLLVSVLGGTGMRVRAIGDMRAGDPVVLLQADKQWVALGGRWAASDHTHPGKATGEWSYSTNTTIADPGSGNLRFSADGLQLAISQTDNGNADYLHVLSALAAEDTITMQETADAAKWAKYEVQGAAVDGGGWFTIDLALIESGGGGAPGNNRLVTVLFTYGVAGGDGGGGYVRRTGDTMTGDLNLIGDGQRQVWAEGTGDIGYGQYALARNGNVRWLIRTGSNSSDVGDGSDAGANLEVHARHDDGSSNGIPLSINRQRGTVSMKPVRWRGRLADRSQPTGGSEYKITSWSNIYTAAGITNNSGTLTVDESGIYAVGGLLRTNRAPTTGQRVLFTCWVDNYWVYRFGMVDTETYGGWTFMFGLNAGGQVDFRVWQSTGATTSFTNMFVHMVKVADL